MGAHILILILYKGVFNIIDTFSFWFDLFYILRAEIKKNDFVYFLVQMRTRKFAFEINWPLIELHRMFTLSGEIRKYKFPFLINYHTGRHPLGKIREWKYSELSNFHKIWNVIHDSKCQIEEKLGSEMFR